MPSALAVYGAQCGMHNKKPYFGCCTGPYESGAFKCEGAVGTVGAGAPDSVEMSR